MTLLLFLADISAFYKFFQNSKIKVNGNLVQFSPTGALIAICYTNKILVRQADTLEVATILTTIDKITQFQWSSDSSLILAVMSTRNKVQVEGLTISNGTSKR